MRLFIFISIFILSSSSINKSIYSAKYTEKAGKDILENKEKIVEAIRLVNAILETPNYQTFLFETAMVESDLGTNKRSWWNIFGNRGRGVWQIDRICFKETKNVKNHPELIDIYKKIYDKTGINYLTDIDYNYCNYIFYGCLTAKIYCIIRKFEIKNNVRDRAVVWKKRYNTYSGKGTVDGYVKKVYEISEKIKT